VASRLVCSRLGNARKCHPRPARASKFALASSLSLSPSLCLPDCITRPNIGARPLRARVGLFDFGADRAKVDNDEPVTRFIRLDNGGSCVNPKSGLERTRCPSTKDGLALRLLCTLARRHYYPIDERYSGRTASPSNPRQSQRVNAWSSSCKMMMTGILVRSAEGTTSTVHILVRICNEICIDNAIKPKHKISVTYTKRGRFILLFNLLESHSTIHARRSAAWQKKEKYFTCGNASLRSSLSRACVSAKSWMARSTCVYINYTNRRAHIHISTIVIA